ncbi:MAG: hypothetical protein ACP5RH_07885 [Leptodesmis sp.]|uniref:hypothetical protein n=1 Tax=Leptodesmis sp. TaxID=3100501 RepID=UPI003D0C353A
MVQTRLVVQRSRCPTLLLFRRLIPYARNSHSPFRSSITVIQGRGVFRLARQEVVLEPGVFIELPANTLHSLSATDDLAMLKVVGSHEVSVQSPDADLCK